MAVTLTNSAGATFLDSHRSSTGNSTKSTSNLHNRNRNHNSLKASLHAVIDEPLVESTKMTSMSFYDVLSVKRDVTACEIKSWNKNCNCWIYLKLDIVHIIVQNTFQWFGGTKKDMNAVHLDVMTIKAEHINLNVGTGTELGESIIHDVKGVSIIISKSLRDLLHQVPSKEVSIKEMFC
ncbi:hypothetical protein Hanom_Chr16g01485661 [Helianthus anomalus]